MADVVIRPTMRYVQLGYLLVFALIAAAFVLHFMYLPDQPFWIPSLAALLLLWPLERQMRRYAAKVSITGDKLRYETGFFSKSTRTIQLSKIQDVRVDQSLSQRIFGVGNISIETAGESSRLTVFHIDHPQHVADTILHAGEQQAGV
jgi:uncharacterized membrane protein YdbT with pleckstrin-like domain